MSAISESPVHGQSTPAFRVDPNARSEHLPLKLGAPFEQRTDAPYTKTVEVTQLQGLALGDLSKRLQLLGRLEDENTGHDDLSPFNPANISSSVSTPQLIHSPTTENSNGLSRRGSVFSAQDSTSCDGHSPVTPRSNGSFEEQDAIRPPATQGVNGTILEEPDGDAVSEELVPRLRKEDVAFAEVEIPTPNLSLRAIRGQLVRNFPVLITPPEPPVKPRKPNAPPPALEPRPRVAGPEEQRARERSLAVSLEKEERRSVIKAQVLLESRKAEWKKVAKATSTDVQDLPVMPSPWLLPIDASAMVAEGKRKNKKVFELPDFRIVASCQTCDATGLVTCPSCAGIEADECFWCSGTGRRRGGEICDNCKGRNVYQCGKCNNAAKITCPECTGDKCILAGYMVEVKLRAIELPAVPVSMLVDPRTNDTPTDPAAVRSCAVDKVLSAVDKLCAEQSSATVPAVAVMARVALEHSIVRTFSVIRPLHVKWRRTSVSDATPDEEQIVGSASSIYDVDGGDLYAQTEHRIFVVPSDPQSPMYESTNRRGSRSRVTSRNPTPAHTPSGPGALSPRPSVGNMAMAFANGQVGLASPASPSSPLEGPTPSSSRRGSVILRTKRSMSKLFTRRGSAVEMTSPMSQPASLGQQEHQMHLSVPTSPSLPAGMEGFSFTGPPSSALPSSPPARVAQS